MARFILTTALYIYCVTGCVIGLTCWKVGGMCGMEFWDKAYYSASMGFSWPLWAIGEYMKN